MAHRSHKIFFLEKKVKFSMAHRCHRPQYLATVFFLKRLVTSPLSYSLVIPSISRAIMAAKWKKFNEEIKAKKRGKNANKFDSIVVQRLSATVSGKAQKYTRVGPS